MGDRGGNEILCPWQAHAATGGEAQEWARAMLGTVGRGGNAQVRKRVPLAP